MGKARSALVRGIARTDACDRRRSPLSRRAGSRVIAAGLRRPAGLLLLAFAVLAAPGCEIAWRDPDVFAPEPQSVTVALPVERSVQGYREFIGHVVASRLVEIRAPVSGRLISLADHTAGGQRDFEPGAIVEEGDLLFVVDPRPYRARLNAANATKRHAEAMLKVAEQGFLAAKEQSEAEKEGVAAATSVRTMSAASAAYQEALAAVAVAEAEIEQAQLALEQTDIRAPFAGRTTARNRVVGELVRPDDAKSLATLMSVDPLHIVFEVNQAELLRLKRRNEERALANQPLRVRVAIEGEQPLDEEQQFQDRYEGRIDFIPPAIDPATGTAEVRASIAGSAGRLLPGLAVQVRVQTEQLEDALMVEPRAVRTDIGGKYLWALGANNVPQQRYVEVGETIDGLRVICNRHNPERGTGIDANERYVVDGLFRPL
ncbi:MAG: efflux RND transporter periplasmic adaptor subunit, partial [Planctomycetota bacterium]